MRGWILFFVFILIWFLESPLWARELESQEQFALKSEAQAALALQRLIVKSDNKPEKAEYLFRLGALYLRSAKSSAKFYQNAAMTFEKIRTARENIFKTFDKHDQVFFNLGFCYQKLNEPSRAQSNLEALLKLYPESSMKNETRLALADIHYDKHRFDVSHELYHQVATESVDTKLTVYGSYKDAWSLYNLKDTRSATDILIALAYRKTHLQSEVIRDLAIFLSDRPVDTAIDTYSAQIKHSTDNRFSDIEIQDKQMLFSTLASIYDSHSKPDSAIRILTEFESELSDAHIDISLKTKAQIIQIARDQRNYSLVIEKFNQINQVCVSPNTPTSPYCAEIASTLYPNTIKQWIEIWKKNKATVNTPLGLLLDQYTTLLPDSESAIAARANYNYENQYYAQAARDFSTAWKLSKQTKSAYLYAELNSYDKYKESDIKLDPNYSEKIFSKSQLFAKLFPQDKSIDEVNLHLASLYISRNDAATAKSILTHLSAKRSLDKSNEFLNQQKNTITSLLQNIAYQELVTATTNKPDLEVMNLYSNFLTSNPDHPKKNEILISSFGLANRLKDVLKAEHLYAETKWSEIKYSTTNDIYSIKEAAFMSLADLELEYGRITKINSLINSSKFEKPSAKLKLYLNNIEVLSKSQPAESDYIETAVKLSFSEARRKASSNVEIEKKIGNYALGLVFNNEFDRQSTKCSMKNLALVLSIKAEKLEKAIHAFSSALKLEKDERNQRQIMTKILNLYTSYQTSLNPTLIRDATEIELKEITDQFKQLSLSLNDRINETKKSIEQLTSLSEEIKIRLPENKQKLNNLLTVQKFNEAESFLMNQLDNEKSQPDEKKSYFKDKGLYFSIFYERKGMYTASLWFIEEALKTNPQSEFLWLQKAHLLQTLGELRAAHEIVEKMSNQKTSVKTNQVATN